MTDPGWDIPGVPRDGSLSDGAPDEAGVSASCGSASSASASSAAGSSRPRRQSGRRARAGSVSACAGLSAGAFAPLRDGPAPATAWSSSSGSGPTAAPAAPGLVAPHDTAFDATVRASTACADGPAPGTDSVRASDAVQALAFLKAGLDYLAHADAAGWPEGAQADCLRALAVAESQQVAAHARVLSAFSVPGGGLAGDGHRSPRVWLTWQAQATRRAASARVSWMHRLKGHPVVAAALGEGSVSLSWAQQIMDWTRRLPDEHRDAADAELLAAAGAGASLSDLAGIAEELRREHAEPDTDDDDGFTDRGLRLVETFGGAGRLEGDLSPRCTAATGAVLGALSQPFGPEDTRTAVQRQHDALEEAMTRLLAAGLLPQRAGQPVRLELDISLPELLAGGAGSPAGPGAACDAVIQPVITGLIDSDLLAQLTGPGNNQPHPHPDTPDPDTPAAAMADHGLLAKYNDPDWPDWRQELQAAAATAVAEAPYGDVLARAIALLSGPAGRAAWLRRRTTGIPAATISLPLDIAATTDTIPVHLRRAVRKRDRHCRFPGCDLPAAGCEVHHIQHRQHGGRHALTNLALLCRFHHLIAIHRWGWQFTLHPDGTTTATSPDGSKTLHSHPPPSKAA